METLPYAAAKPPVVVMAPLSDLFVPDWNPRKYIDLIALANLTDFMRAGGKPPRIIFWRGNGTAPFAIIEGQMRFLAAQKLGWTHIEAEEDDCTLVQAKLRADTSNNQNETYWLDRYENWERLFDEHPEWKNQVQKASNLGVDPSWVSRCESLLKLLNPASRSLIREDLGKSTVNDNKNSEGQSEVHESFMKPEEKSADKWVLLEGMANRLLPLLPNRALVTAQDLGYQALKVIIAQRLKGPQIKSLVDHMQTGGDPTQFDPAKKPATAPSAHEASKTTHAPIHQVEAVVADGSDPATTAQVIAPESNPDSQTPALALNDSPKTKETSGSAAQVSGFWKDIQDIFQGFTGAGLKDLFGKIPQGNKWKALGYIFEKILLGGMGHLIKLGWKLFILLAKHTGKGVHSVSKSIATMAVPTKVHRSQNPLAFVGHWLIYGFITVFCYSILLSLISIFVPGVGPWFRAEIMIGVHLLAQVPLWVFSQILQNAWMAFGFGFLLLWMIHKTFNPGFGWILTLGVILFVAWCLRGWVMSGCHVTLPDFSSLSTKAQRASVDLTMPKVAETVPPGPKPQVDLSAGLPTAASADAPRAMADGSAKVGASAKVEEPPTQKVAQTKPTTPQHKKTAPGKKKTPIPLSQMALPMHIPTDSQFAEAFCAALYNIKYQDPYFNSDAVAAMLTTDNGQDIVDGYYAEDRMKRIEDDKETWAFKADGDPVLTAK